MLPKKMIKSVFELMGMDYLSTYPPPYLLICREDLTRALNRELSRGIQIILSPFPFKESQQIYLKKGTYNDLIYCTIKNKKWVLSVSVSRFLRNRLDITCENKRYYLKVKNL